MTTMRPSDGYGFPFISSHVSGIEIARMARALDAVSPTGGYALRVVYDHMLRLEADQRAEFKKRYGLVPRIGRAERAAQRRPKRNLKSE